MKIVKFNCAGCGAELDKPVDELSVYKCKYCGHENHIEENYKIKFVPTHGAKDIKELINEKKIEAAQYLNNKNYKMAFDTYYYLYDYTPRDVEVLEGLMRSLTGDFDQKYFENNYNDIRYDYDTYFDVYKEVQTDQIKVQFFQKKFIQLCNSLFLKRLFSIIGFVIMLFLMFSFYMI